MNFILDALHLPLTYLLTVERERRPLLFVAGKLSTSSRRTDVLRAGATASSLRGAKRQNDTRGTHKADATHATRAATLPMEF